MKELNAKDLDQVSGGRGSFPYIAGEKVTFFCKKCNKSFEMSSGTQNCGICPTCGEQGERKMS